MDAVGNSLRPNPAVSQVLEGEMVRPSCRCGVDLNCSGLHRITDQNCLVDVSGEDATLKCEVVCIAVVNAFLHGLDSEDRDDWSKGLLPRNSHIRCHVVNEDWPN